MSAVGQNENDPSTRADMPDISSQVHRADQAQGSDGAFGAQTVPEPSNDEKLYDGHLKLGIGVVVFMVVVIILAIVLIGILIGSISNCAAGAAKTVSSTVGSGGLAAIVTAFIFS